MFTRLKLDKGCMTCREDINNKLYSYRRHITCVNISTKQSKCSLQETAEGYLGNMTGLYREFKDGFSLQKKEGIAKGKA